MCFLLSLSNAECSSSMTEHCLSSFLTLLMKSFNTSSTIFTRKSRELITSLLLLINILLIPMSSITGFLPLSILLAGTSNGIHIFMLSFLLAVLTSISSLKNLSSIAGQWKYHVLDIIKNGNYPNEKIKRMSKKTVSELYEKDTRFFFNVGNGDINNTKGIIRYLGRYFARSPLLLNTKLPTLQMMKLPLSSMT